MVTVIAINDNYLSHHGIKGQKWGIRRYQNYDGSYTQAGMKRYNASLEKYNQANERYKTAKKTKASKTEITNARMQRKRAKNQLDKDYAHLKQDKLGEQGKELYSKGKTITGNETATAVLGSIGGMSLAAAGYMYTHYSPGSYATATALSTIGLVSISAASVKKVSDNYQAKRLRAYYSHTSNY